MQDYKAQYTEPNVSYEFTIHMMGPGGGVVLGIAASMLYCTIGSALSLSSSPPLMGS